MPVAGEILPPEQWTQTALKRLPEGLLDWRTVFGREAPVVLDLGCGNGRYLLSSAVWRPQFDHLGCDLLPLVIRYATRRANQRGLSNVRFAVIDGETLLREHVASSSVTEIHVYHPQPYYDPQKKGRRMMTPAFLADCRRCLAPGGRLHLQTDHGAYWRYMREAAGAFFQVEERFDPWPDAPKGRTRREIIALREGLTVYRGVATPRLGIDEAEVQRLIDSLPLPEFHADPRWRALDEL